VLRPIFNFDTFPTEKRILARLILAHDYGARNCTLCEEVWPYDVKEQRNVWQIQAK